MAQSKTGSLLRKYGATLIENGWAIIPIPAGKKGPILNGWQRIKATASLCRTWSEGEYKRGNIGFLTKYTPAVDIDIYDEEMSGVMRAHTENIVGKTLWRVGQAPKIMLVYRTDEPFTKRKMEFIDTDGVEHKIEILGDGQQFVGIGIHPDTQRAFKWQSKAMSPVGMSTDMLPEINGEHINRIFEVFKIEAERRGWTLKSHTASSSKAMTMIEADNENDAALLAFKTPLDNLSTEQLREILTWVTGNDDYEQWLTTGMALHHQYDGEEDGLKLWHEWSEGAHNYDADALEAKWNSFHDDIGRNITTAATLIKKARENKQHHAQEQFEKIKRKVEECTSEVELLGTLAAKWGRQLESDYQVDLLASAIVERVKAITGKRVRVELVRKAIGEGYNSGFDYKELPFWCANVVYVDRDEQFYLMDQRLPLSERAFNSRNNRHLLSKKDRTKMEATPEQQASQLALNVFQVPVVSGYIYLPGLERIVNWDGNDHVNLFNGDDLAALPSGKLSGKERRAVEAVKRHFEISYPIQRERELLLSWLAYTIKRMDKKIRWAPVIQGVDGGGKGFIGEMLMAIMGKSNVITMSAQALEEKYTSFFESRKVVVLEEARIHGTTRYAVMDKLKPYITNDVVDIRRMHKDSYNIPSVVNIMILTNHADALPVYDADRRYFVVSTFFETKHTLEQFRAENPEHFPDIFDAIAYHPGAIREWLEDFPLHPEFNADGHAPHTQAKDRMAELSRGDSETDELEDILHRNEHHDVSAMLLNVSALRDVCGDLGVALPIDAKLASFLTARGFVYIGRARNADGRNCRFWSRHPERIQREDGKFQRWVNEYYEFSL